MCVCAAMRALRARLGTSSIFIRSIVSRVSLSRASL
jgi:hypothetical protein